MSPEDIARICHEVNRGYCQALGDDSQLPWEEAPEWQRQSAISGVLLHLRNPEATPATSHESWLEAKKHAGWTWGPEKDPDAKQHPCIMPFAYLPPEQRAKDHIFKAIVNALSTCVNYD